MLFLVILADFWPSDLSLDLKIDTGYISRCIAIKEENLAFTETDPKHCQCLMLWCYICPILCGLR